ncbi:MAG TPA: hypothetical protein VID26_06770 [Candidatus Limnocylindrales bacterium]
MSRPNARVAGPRRAGLKVAVLGAAWVGSFMMVVGALAEALAANPDGALLAAITVPSVASTVAVGAVLVNRLPRHIVGQLLLAGGLVAAVSTAAGAVADYGLNRHPGSIPGAIGFAILANASGGVYLGLLGGFVPSFFPTGRLLSPRWRAMVAFGLVATFVPVLTNILGPISPGTYPTSAANPLALGGPAGQLVALTTTAANDCGVLALVLVIASVVVRYRHAQGVERAQLKWFAYVGLVVVPTIVIGIVTSSATSGPLTLVTNVAWLASIAGLGLLPIAIGVAVLRYRLYEIDRLISRTISWALVSVLVIGLFAGLVLALQAVLASVLRSNELVVAGSTLVVAAMFQPIRGRVQRIVDRRFNRARYDADRTIGAFAGRLRDEVDLEQLRAEILATVARTVEPSSVSLWLRE